ncbi:MAG: penicillin-binding protein activator [Ascidiaceihabitans sp.]|nr:penicillin-binding protein activator [Ascidiaceihabitans sp.]
MFALFQSARKTLRRLKLPIFGSVMAMTLAACDPAALTSLSNNGPKVDKNVPVAVALLVPRGGGSASDDLLAQSLENAARLAIRDLQGVQIDLRVYGTGGKAATAASQAAQAVNDGAKIIIGPLYAEAANAVGVAVAGQNVNVLAFSNNATIAGGNVFVLGPTFQNTANRMVSYAKSQGKDRIVVTHAQDVAGQLGRNAVSNAIASAGSTLVGSVEYPLSQQGVVAAIPKIKAAVDNGAANAVFMTSPSASALPLLTQLLPEAGVKSQFIGLTRWDIPVQTLDLPGVQGGWFALPDPARSAAFRSKYEAAYGKAPHPIAALSFDGIAAVGALMNGKKSSPLSTAAITQSAGFQGATGIFRLRPDGTNERGLAIATIRNSQVVVIDNAPAGFGGAGF